jgi:hypothetical protein
MQRTAQHTGREESESKGDMMTWAGNTMAIIGAAVGIGTAQLACLSRSGI